MILKINPLNPFKSLLCISPSFTYIIKRWLILLHLELVSSVWNPKLEYDSKKLEGVQRKAILTKESPHLSYEERLKRLDLTDLKTRRMISDFIQTDKLDHGLEKVNWSDENNILIPNQQTACRTHPFQLSRELTRGNESRTHFLLNRMITRWNNLPKNIVLEPSVNLFKNRLDLYLKRAGRSTCIYS